MSHRYVRSRTAALVACCPLSNKACLLPNKVVSIFWKARDNEQNLTTSIRLSAEFINDPDMPQLYETQDSETPLSCQPEVGV